MCPSGGGAVPAARRSPPRRCALRRPGCSPGRWRSSSALLATHAAVARRRRPLPVPRARDHDLDDVRARLQPAARPRRPAVVRARRVLRRRRLRASACCSKRVVANLWLDLGRRGARGRARRRARRRVHLAPARHLLRAADDRLRPGVLVRRDQVAQRHRRRGRAAQHQAAAGRLRLRARRACARNEALFYFALGGVRAGGRRPVAAGALAVRPRAARDQAERDARRLRRLQRLALQVARLRDLGGDRRARRRAVRDGAAVGLSERDEPAQLRASS